MLGKHPKQDFQVERLAFFSDAVFAIAITLLVIEFKVPEVTKNSTYAEVWHEVSAMKLKFFALLGSFIFIAGYWMRHHSLFKYIHNYNRRMVVINLVVLFPVTLFPFTTAFLYESTANETVVIIPYRLFLLNHVVASGTMYYFCWLVTRKYKEFIYPIEKKEEDMLSLRMLVTCICFILAFTLSFVSVTMSWLGLLPLGVLRIYNRFSKNKNNLQHAK